MAAGVQLDVETVDLKTHKTASGADFYAINKKGNVPALVLDDGTVLNEGAAVLQWIADQKPDTIAPAVLTTARYVVINALNYVASEVHPSIGGLFNPTLTADTKAHVTANAHRRLDFLDKELADKPYMTGEKVSIADLYLYIVLTWTPYVGLTLDKHAHVKAFFERVGALDAVKAAHARMGTSPATTL